MSSETKQVKPAGFMHMTATREWVLRALNRYPQDFREIVPEAQSLEEAQAVIINGPRVHPVGTCEGFDYEEGKCPGHEREATPAPTTDGWTAGPWRVGKVLHVGRGEHMPGVYQCSVLMPHPEHDGEETLACIVEGATYDEAVARARLIAAAPELVAMLRGIIDARDSAALSDDPAYYWIDREIANARALLATVRP